MSNDQQTPQSMMAAALDHLQSAIELLDRADAPGQIAAHVDLAVNQLFDEISNIGIHESSSSASRSPNRISQ